MGHSSFPSDNRTFWTGDLSEYFSCVKWRKTESERVQERVRHLLMKLLYFESILHKLNSVLQTLKAIQFWIDAAAPHSALGSLSAYTGIQLILQFYPDLNSDDLCPWILGCLAVPSIQWIPFIISVSLLQWPLQLLFLGM